jgi:hypothetical protein
VGANLSQFTSNEQLLSAVQRLVEAWCDRRCLGALRHILAGYPLTSPLTDGWGELYDALRNVRSFSRDELAHVEMDAVNELITEVGKIVYR